MPGQLDPLVERLKKALGPELVSVVLYGSAAVGDYEEKFSDYNILCVLSQITPAQLGATESIFRWWREQGNPAPLLLTETEVRTSTDCFAIEFHDIKEHHRILHGADVVSSLTIDQSFYRAQVSTICARSCCGCVRKRPACFQIRLCCGICWPIRFRRSVCSSDTR